MHYLHSSLFQKNWGKYRKEKHKMQGEEGKVLERREDEMMLEEEEE